MLNLASIRTDLSEVIADLPVTCAYLGTSFAATSSDEGQGRALELDGTVIDVDRSIVADAANVPAGITATKQITVDGSPYRVLRVSRHQDGVGIEIDLKAVVR